MSLQDNKTIVQRFHNELYNKGNVDIIDELMDPNLVAHPGMRSREDFKASVQQNFAAWPELAITLEDVVAEGDMVMFRWAFVLRHTREAMGVAPTGQEIKLVGFSQYRIAGGKIVEDWSASDMLGFYKQLGTAPSMDGVAPSTWD
jgi:predicted ester cyclase